MNSENHRIGNGRLFPEFYSLLAKNLGIKGESGLVGMKGEPGIVGNQGRKGEKGESAKASQASVVPQTNWKQCVWTSSLSTDNGMIKVIRIGIITRP